MVSKAIAGNRRTLAIALSFLLFLVIIKVEVKNLTIMDFVLGLIFLLDFASVLIFSATALRASF